MKPYRNKLSLRSINAHADKTGRIQGYFAPSAPIKGFVCEWPRYAVLTPPMAAKAIVEKSPH